MKILGIDVGFAITGWGIVEKDSASKNQMKLIDYGAIFTESDLEIHQRLELLYKALNKVIKEYKPDVLAVESIFFFKNQKTVINVAQARGVILLAGQLNKLPIFAYTPLQVKTALTGYGRADKQQIQKMVKLMFSLQEAPKPDDVADAIAIAVCHLNHSSSLLFKYK